MRWMMAGTSADVAGRIMRAMLAPACRKRVLGIQAAHIFPGACARREREDDMETGRPQFGSPQGAEELAAVADIISQAFAMTAHEGVSWVEKATPANLRVLRENGQVTATALPIPMGQW